MPAATAAPKDKFHKGAAAPVAKREAARKRTRAKASQQAAPVQRGDQLNERVVQLATGANIEAAARHIALEILRQATPEQREEFCPAGLAGKQRTLFIEQAVTTRESIELARQHRAMQDALNHAKQEEAKMTTTATPKTVKPSTRSRKQSEQPKSARTTKRTEQASQPSVITASSIAKDNGLDPVAFRKWLRAADLRAEGRAAVFVDKRKRTALIKRFEAAQVAAAK